MRFHDLTLAVRQAGRRPGFTATAILLLALGAGANAAVFSVVRGVLLRPLPYPQPDRLVAVWPTRFVSNEDLDYWRIHTHSFDEIAAQSPGWMMALTSRDGEAIKVTGAKTSDNMFRTLGARPALGRAIEPGDAVPGQPRVAVLSDGLWRRRFGADPSAIGRVVELDQEPHTIVGVMPAGFEVFEPGTEVWAALPWTPGTGSFRTTFSQSLARLADGVTVDAATRELKDITPAMRRQLGRDDEWGRTIHVASLQDTITGPIRPTLLVLLGAVGLMLLLAAVNLGTLVLGRSLERTGEMAVRTALGASRTRLVRQLVAEQTVLALTGTIAGIALAYVLLPALVAQIPPEVPRAAAIALDWTVLFAVLGASVGSAIAVALVPACLSARPALTTILRQSRVTDTPERRRVLGLLVAGQIALAVVLGAGALLMLRSIWNLQHIDPGFRSENVLTWRMQTTSKYRDLATGLPYLQQVVDRVLALPGVTRVGAIGHPPLSGTAWTIGLRREDQPIPAGAHVPHVGWRFIGWDYFEAMSIPMRHGRRFTADDRDGATQVAIVNETLARRFFGEPSAALGRMLVQQGGGTPGEAASQVVGVVADVLHLGLDQEPTPEIYRPLAQTFMFPMAMVMRTSGPPASLAAAVRQAAFEIDPAIPVAELQPYSTLVADTLGRPRLLGFLLAVFAGAGLTLGLLGVYGVAMYRVRRHEREIGIRLALGAEPNAISRQVVSQGLVFGLAGLAIGIPAALAVARVMESVIFGIAPHDPATFVALPLIIVTATIAATLVPARRAARVDPIAAMRDE